jgi:nitroreductase
MEVLEAIYSRRSVRDYAEEPVNKATVEKFLDVAVQAPSAMNSQPWAFAVIQDRALLDDLSDRAKAHLLQNYADEPRMERYRETLSDPAFDIFYGASTLIVVCATTEGLVPNEDCCMAGQNLLLAARALGLATCCIGWARPLLMLAEVKTELGIPEEVAPVLPIIFGRPRGSTVPVPRRPPRILLWR